SGGTYTDIPGETNSTYTAISLNQNTYYKVKVTSGSRTDVSASAQVIIVKPSPVADFTSTPLGNHTVSFNSSGSVGATSYLWTFGDAANSTSTDPNPTFTYTKDSTYHVCLEV